jgi:hypothetical protein
VKPFELEVARRRREYNRSGWVDPRVDYPDPRTRRERDTLRVVEAHLRDHHRLKARRIMVPHSVKTELRAALEAHRRAH